MAAKKALTSVVLGLTTAGLLALPVSTAAADDNGNDDRKVRYGKTVKGAKYKVTVAERDDDRVRTTFFINSNKNKGRKWTVRMYRNGTLVHKDTKRTGRYGNVRFRDTFRADDDARVKVVARSGYGDRAKRVVKVDD